MRQLKVVRSVPSPSKMRFKLVFFDCDGVLHPEIQWIRLHQAAGISKELNAQWLNEYYSGKITHARWIKNIESYYLKNGLTRSLFEKILSEFEINSEAYPLIEYLKKKGIKTATISSGIDYYVKPIARKLGLNFLASKLHF